MIPKLPASIIGCVCLLASGILSGCGSGSFGSSGDGTTGIRGRATAYSQWSNYTSRDDAGGAVIQFWDSTDTKVARRTTNSSGEFEVPLQPGTYTVSPQDFTQGGGITFRHASSTPAVKPKTRIIVPDNPDNPLDPDPPDSPTPTTTTEPTNTQSADEQIVTVPANGFVEVVIEYR